MRYHCGISEFCRRTSEATYLVAKSNIESDFVTVLIVENMLLSFRVLEARLPSLFGGIVNHYNKLGQIRVRQSAVALHPTSNKFKESIMKVAPELRLEYKLYDFAVARLESQALLCGIITDSSQ